MPRKTKRISSCKNKTHKQQKKIRGGGLFDSSSQPASVPTDSSLPPFMSQSESTATPPPAPCEGWRKTFGMCKSPSVGGKKKSKKSEKSKKSKKSKK